MEYAEIAQFARSWGLAYLVVLFLGICAYAFWPRNRDKFERASRIPLEED